MVPVLIKPLAMRSYEIPGKTAGGDIPLAHYGLSMIVTHF